MQIVKRVTGRFNNVTTVQYNVYVNYGTLTYTSTQGASISGAGLRDGLGNIVEEFLTNDCHVKNIVRIPTLSTAITTQSVNAVCIFGIPITFIMTASTSSNYSAQYRVALPDGIGFEGSAITISATMTGAPGYIDYDFYLVFTGNPESAFTLRVVPYNANGGGTTATSELFVAKAHNIATKQEMTAFAYRATSGGTIGTVHYANIKDDDTYGKLIDMNTYSHSNTVSIAPVLETTANDLALTENQIPLIHLKANNILFDGLYQTPRNFGLPETSQNNVIIQPEFKTGGKKFIQTANAAGNSGTYGVSQPIGIGLIDVTNDAEIGNGVTSE